MNKQLLLTIGAVLLIFFLFVFGKTTHPFETAPTQAAAKSEMLDIAKTISEAKSQLTPEQILYVTSLENNISRGDVVSQQVENFRLLAAFYKDSAQLKLPYLHYISEQAKLENSEKSLTFAGQIFLGNLRGEHTATIQNWETAEAISLFEKALEKNPANTDLKIGLGSAYIYGRGQSGDPAETMKGIQQLLSVVREDSTNMKAQMVLGIGGYASGQFDKAIERFVKVVNAQPENIEAIAFLADTYAAQGNRTEAVKWYEASKKLVNDPAYSAEVDKRISEIK